VILKEVNEQKPREIAGHVLLQRTAGKDYVENLLDQALAHSRMSPADRGLCQELVFGVVRWEATLDWLIERKAPEREQKPLLQILLRMGLYQIFWLDRIPAHAAVNETVEHAKRSGFGPQAGFINAVLRGYLREVEETKAALADLKRTQPHLGYSHPQWLVERWQKRWGVEATTKLLEWNNTPAKTFGRINTLAFSKEGRIAMASSPSRPGVLSGGPTIRRPFLERTFKDAGDVLAQWRDEGIEYDFVRRSWLDDNLIFEFKSHPPIATLPSFQNGLFYVQDPSTLAAVNELDPQPGETILDLCAAPGGKTTYIAQLMENRGRVIAHDVAPDRLKLIQENCARLGATCVETFNSAQLSTTPLRFDRILVDAPCSNTGVMRRRVDLRWRIRPEEIKRLRTTQLQLLEQAARLLKPGGTLVYSTCSLEEEENEAVADAFVERNANMNLDCSQRIAPPVNEADGAYVASISNEL
jgi:16S rRNA (cytosine967-C5)-methyltransferase